MNIKDLPQGSYQVVDAPKPQKSGGILDTVKGIGKSVIQSEINFGKDLSGGLSALIPGLKEAQGKAFTAANQNQNLHGEVISKYHALSAQNNPKAGFLAPLINDRANQDASGTQSPVQAMLPEGAGKTKMQVLGDAAGVAFDALSAGTYGKGAAALETGKLGKALPTAVKETIGGIKQGAIGGVKQGIKYGAGYGGVQGAIQGVQDDEGLGGIAGRAAEGAIYGGAAGGALGGVAGGITHLGSNKMKTGSFFAGKTPQEIVATPEAALHKLSTPERKLYFDNLRNNLEEKSTSVEREVGEAFTKKTAALEHQSSELERMLATGSRDKVLELRPKALKGMAQQSRHYRDIVEKELEGKSDTVVDSQAISQYVEQRFGDNPARTEAILRRMGLTPSGELQASELASQGGKRTIGEVFDQIKGLKQERGTAAVKGSRVYSADEMLTEDAISSLTAFLKENGVDLAEANRFWARYAPVRNQLIRELKPFNMSGTETKTFAGTLTRVLQGRDVNNENFISAVESLVGEPVGPNLKKVITQLDENAKAKIAAKVEAQGKILEQRLAHDLQIKKISEKEFEAGRKAGWRKLIRGAIITLGTGGLAATGARAVYAIE